MEHARKQIRTYSGGCHCGAVRYQFKAPAEPEVLECNCSICAKTGFLHLIVPKEFFHLLSGDGKLQTYRFNTGKARHLFCKTCGIKPFYIPRSHPDSFSVNALCLDDADSITFRRAQFDGQHWEENIHRLRPADNG